MDLLGRTLQCWGTWMSTLGSFPSHYRNHRPWGHLLIWRCAGLGRGNAVRVQPLLLTFLRSSFSVFVFQGVLQPHPWVLRFSHCCLVYGYLPAGPAKGTEVWNDLCHHLEPYFSDFQLPAATKLLKLFKRIPSPCVTSSQNPMISMSSIEP